MSKMMKIELSMYGIAEVLHWCHDRNKGRVPGVDTAGFEKMKVLLAEKPQSGDYFTLDQFWKKKAILDLTEDEMATIDRCLYDIPNFDSEPLPQIRHKFWPQQAAALEPDAERRLRGVRGEQIDIGLDVGRGSERGAEVQAQDVLGPELIEQGRARRVDDAPCRDALVR